MPHLSTQAIVLQTIDYGEYDRLVSLYTRDFGRLRAIAKGAKRSQKRFGSALEPCTHVQADFVDREHRGLSRLERCRIISAFPELALDIRKVAYGHYFLELADILAPSNPMDKVAKELAEVRVPMADTAHQILDSVDALVDRLASLRARVRL